MASVLLGLVAVAGLLSGIDAMTPARPHRPAAPVSDGTPTAGAAPTNQSPPSTSLPQPASRGRIGLACAEASPLAGVLEVTTDPTRTPSFFVTHDFSTYARVTTSFPPTLPTPSWNLCRTDFTTPAVGWGAYSRAGPDPVAGTLYETTDGGGHWRLVRTLGCGCFR